MIYRLVAYSLVLLGIVGTIYIAVEGIYRDEYDTPSIDFDELNQRLTDSTDLTIIDVRNVDEIAEQELPWDDVMHIPLFLLEKRSLELTPYKDQPLLLICPNGKRSKQGARTLRLAGFDAYYLEDGLEGS